MNKIKKSLIIAGCFTFTITCFLNVVFSYDYRDEIIIAFNNEQQHWTKWNHHQLKRIEYVLRDNLNILENNLSWNKRHKLVVRSFNEDKIINALKKEKAHLAYMPTSIYYNNSLLIDSDYFNQLVPVLKVKKAPLYNELEISKGIGINAKIKKMNENLEIKSMIKNEKNIYRLVQSVSHNNNYHKINDHLDENVSSNYYRNYHYISKKSLLEYYKKRVDSPLNNEVQLKEAWLDIVEVKKDDNTKLKQWAVFKNNKTSDVNNYWMVVWDIFVQSVANNSIGLNINKDNFNERISLISSILETYLIVNKLDDNDFNNLQSAKQVVFQMLNNNYFEYDKPKEIYDYLSNEQCDINIISNQNYKNKDWKNNKEYQPIIFLASQGFINEQIVTTKKFYNNNFNLLVSLQDIFTKTMNDNIRYKKILFENAHQISYEPIDLNDTSRLKWNKKISESLNDELINIATEISHNINPMKKSES